MFNLLGWQAKLGEYLIVIAVVVGAAWYTYNAGYDAADDSWKVAQANSNRIAQERYDGVATKLENTKAERIIQTNTITKIIPQIVEREVYKNVCIDQQGMDVANKALRGESYEAPK